jgi:membrane associated rhomboid family serine protease
MYLPEEDPTLTDQQLNKIQQRLFFHSLLFPALFVLAIWMIELVERTLGLNFAKYGLFPLEWEGLRGIILSPLIHSGFKHLFNNSVPILVLGTALFYFYRALSYRIFFLIYLLSGLWLWFFGRQSYHIGASGLVYGLASFLFFSGIFRKYFRLMAISLLVVFLYGSLIWGIFPIRAHISWEGHLMGGIAGLILAVFYKNQGPQRPKYSWELEEEEETKYENDSDDLKS